MYNIYIFIIHVITHIYILQYIMHVLGSAGIDPLGSGFNGFDWILQAASHPSKDWSSLKITASLDARASCVSWLAWQRRLLAKSMQLYTSSFAQEHKNIGSLLEYTAKADGRVVSEASMELRFALSQSPLLPTLVWRLRWRIRVLQCTDHWWPLQEEQAGADLQFGPWRCM